LGIDIVFEKYRIILVVLVWLLLLTVISIIGALVWMYYELIPILTITLLINIAFITYIVRKLRREIVSEHEEVK